MKTHTLLPPDPQHSLLNTPLYQHVVDGLNHFAEQLALLGHPPAFSQINELLHQQGANLNPDWSLSFCNENGELLPMAAACKAYNADTLGRAYESFKRFVCNLPYTVTAGQPGERRKIEGYGERFYYRDLKMGLELITDRANEFPMLRWMDWRSGVLDLAFLEELDDPQDISWKLNEQLQTIGYRLSTAKPFQDVGSFYFHADPEMVPLLIQTSHTQDQAQICYLTLFQETGGPKVELITLESALAIGRVISLKMD